MAIEPSWCQALFFKGFALDGQGRFDEAIPFLERAVSMAPQHAQYLNELGYAYQQAKNWPKSMDAYQRARDAAAALSGNRETAEKTRALRGIGFVLVETGDWNGAEGVYKESLKLDPEDRISPGELRYIAEHRPK